MRSTTRRTGDRFCTAVYLRVEPSAQGVDVTLANGGHPPALILRDDGRVEPVSGETGMLLGLFPDAIDRRPAGPPAAR